MVVPPYYYGQNPAMVIAHYRALAAGRRTAHHPLQHPRLHQSDVGTGCGRRAEGRTGHRRNQGQRRELRALPEPGGGREVGGFRRGDRQRYAALRRACSWVGMARLGPGPTSRRSGSWACGTRCRMVVWTTRATYQRKIRSLSEVYRCGGFHPGLKGALAALGVCQPIVTSPMTALG